MGNYLKYDLEFRKSIAMAANAMHKFKFQTELIQEYETKGRKYFVPIPVVVKNVDTKEEHVEPSMTACASFVGCHPTTIRKYIMLGKPYGKYLLTRQD